MPLVGFLSTRSPDEAEVHAHAFRRGLEEMGYVEGRSVAVEYRWANGDYSLLPALAADQLSAAFVNGCGRRSSRACGQGTRLVDSVRICRRPGPGALWSSPEHEPAGKGHGCQLLYR